MFNIRNYDMNVYISLLISLYLCVYVNAKETFVAGPDLRNVNTALNAAEPGDIITMLSGTWNGCTPGYRIVFGATAGVVLRGHDAVIDCQNAAGTIAIVIDSGCSGGTIESLTLINGITGINHMVGCAITVRNCTFSNWVDNAIYVNAVGASVNLSSSTIRNSAAGLMMYYNGHINVENSVLANITSFRAIEMSGAVSLVVFNSEISNCSNGAVYADSGGTITILDSAMDNNGPAPGAAIMAQYDMVVNITSSTFDSNVWDWSGGSFYFDHSSTLVMTGT